MVKRLDQKILKVDSRIATLINKRDVKIVSAVLSMGSFGCGHHCGDRDTKRFENGKNLFCGWFSSFGLSVCW